MTTYRELTIDDLAKLVKEAAASINWQAYREFALTIYGDKAHKIVTATGEEYNDQTYDDVVEYVTVYDVDDNELAPDLLLPFWQDKIKAHAAEIEQRRVDPWWLENYPNEIESGFGSDDQEECTAELMHELPTLDNDETEFTFFVNEPPVKPRVFIAE
jgi:hypothetical protein